MSGTNQSLGSTLLKLAAIAGIVACCITAIALIPAFGQWLFPRPPTTPPPPSARATDLLPTETNKPPSPPTETDEPPLPPTDTDKPLLGKGDIVRGNGLSIQLVDYEIRPLDHPENAAIMYTLAFINERNASIEIKFSLADISAVDNVQNYYGDFFAVAKKWYESTGQYMCVLIGAEPVYELDQQFSLSPNSIENIDYYLNSVDSTESDCNNWGGGKSRVVFETDFVDLKFATVSYRTNQLFELSNLKWRLVR